MNTEVEGQGQTYGIGTRASRARFERLTKVFVTQSPLFQGLSMSMQQDIFDMGVSRTFSRGAQLRGVSLSSTVHVVLRGCVAERSPYADGTSLQFRGVGAVLGAPDVFYDDTAVPSSAECLDQTWTLSYPLERMRMLADADTTLMRNLSTGIAMQLRSLEKVYSSFRLPPVERVAGLLEDLCNSCGVRFDSTNEQEKVAFQVGGPTQNDIAEALLLSRATVERTFQTLRKEKILHTSYRKFTILNFQHLKEVARGLLIFEQETKAE